MKFINAHSIKNVVKCANCKRNSQVFNIYLSKWMCKDCFTKMIEDRIRKTIRDKFEKNDKVVIIKDDSPTYCVFSYFFPKIAKRIPGLKIIEKRWLKNKTNYDKIAICKSADEFAVDILEQIMIKGKKPVVSIKKGKIIYPTVRISEFEAKEYCKIKKLGYKEKRIKTKKDLREFLKKVENRRKGSMFGIIKSLLKQR